MKKILIATIFLALATSLTFGASLTVIQPNGGEKLLIGATYQIQWKAVDINENVKLLLYKGTTKLGLIAQGLSVTPSAYPWKVGEYDGGTAAPGSDYRIRIRTMSNGPNDFSDGFFTLESLKTNMLHLEEKVPHAAISAALQSIQVTEPATGSKWAESGKFTIRWKTFLKKWPTLELYNYSGTTKVATIIANWAILKYHEDGQYQYDWTIPKGIYSWPGNYKIRVSADNGKYEGFSAMFHIDKDINMVEKSYNVEAHVNNQAHRHYSFKCTSIDKSGMAFPEGPGPGIMRVGWENSWKQWGVGNYCHRQLDFAYRSFITFDVSAFAQGKIIQKATLYINRESTHYTDGTTASNVDYPGHCASKLYQVLAPWSDAFNVPVDLIGDGTAGSFDITAIVRSWALKGDNHGLLLVGRDESYKKNNEECISYYKAFLNIKTLENEN
jgi:hypothetical protein